MFSSIRNVYSAPKIQPRAVVTKKFFARFSFQTICYYKSLASLRSGDPLSELVTINLLVNAGAYL